MSLVYSASQGSHDLDREKVIACIARSSQRDPNTGCWLWERGLDQSGYGMISLHGYRERRAHRASYAVFVGPIPTGYLVRHSCDVPICVNPEHLTLGTHADNMADMKSRNRQARTAPATGFDRRGYRLTPEQVSAIYRADGSSYEISRRSGVTASMVRRIRRGEAWVEITAGLVRGRLAHIPGLSEPSEANAPTIPPVKTGEG